MLFSPGVLRCCGTRPADATGENAETRTGESASADPGAAAKNAYPELHDEPTLLLRSARSPRSGQTVSECGHPGASAALELLEVLEL
jgi:hypothetical protein